MFELMRDAIRPSFDELLRNPERYEDRLVYVAGEVCQVLSRDVDAIQLRLCDDDRNDVFILTSTERGPNFLEGDPIEVAGIMTGIFETKTVLGAPVFIPMISAIKTRR